MHRRQQTLYFFTVFLTVYSMRDRGLRRQPRDLLNDLGTTGQLYFGPVPLDDYGLRMEARLITPEGQDLILPLQYAQIRRIQGVIHIVGKEPNQEQSGGLAAILDVYQRAPGSPQTSVQGAGKWHGCHLWG